LTLSFLEKGYRRAREREKSDNQYEKKRGGERGDNEPASKPPTKKRGKRAPDLEHP